MDASTIRLILIVVGALVILLLYLWERHRERREELDEEPYFDDEDEDVGYARPARRYDPHFDDEDDGEYEDEYEDEREAPQEAHREVRHAALEQSGRAQSADRLGARMVDEDAESDIGREDDEDSEESYTPAMDTPKPEPLLIQVSVSARRYPFKGTDLMEVAERCGLYPGEMDIFHCLDEFDDHTRVYFSMANMIKPGTFPFETMESFTTPGLMLFAQLEGDPEDMTILDEMVATARKLAMALNGDVLDDTRRALTVTKEEEMRQAVLANEMRWAKAVMR